MELQLDANKQKMFSLDTDGSMVITSSAIPYSKVKSEQGETTDDAISSTVKHGIIHNGGFAWTGYEM